MTVAKWGDREIHNGMDIIYSREIKERIGALELYEEDEDFPEEDKEELEKLRALRDEVGGEWRYSVALIRESYFEDYARDLASDIHGKAVDDAAWPFDCIDWERAADQLKMDYTSVEFDGVDYWYRS